jgi:hypothetical protein
MRTAHLRSHALSNGGVCNSICRTCAPGAMTVPLLPCRCNCWLDDDADNDAGFDARSASERDKQTSSEHNKLRSVGHTQAYTAAVFH